MIEITWVTELIDQIPEIISYIVYGYVYLSAYYWISFKDNNDFKNFIIKSIATSYLLTTCYELLISNFNIIIKSDNIKVVIYFIISALLGLLIGKIISHRWFNNLLHVLHIGRTTNKNIWDDVIRPGVWLRVFMKDGSSYLGQYRYGEPFKSEPIIVLETYQKLNNNADVIIDNSQKMDEKIMLNTKDFEKIEVTYTIEEFKKTKGCFKKIKNFFTGNDENQEQGI